MSAYQTLTQIFEKLSQAAGFLLVFFLLGFIAQKIICSVGKRSDLPDVFSFAGQAVKFTLFAAGIMLTVNSFGVNVGALLAGLGVTGIVLGFALQNTLSNMVAGVIILSSQPFRIGDYIAAGGCEGKVIEIGLRYTILEATDKKILLPNSLLSTSPITISKRPK